MLQKGNKKVINGWCFYDWANSSYPLVITTAIFPIFYDQVISDDPGNKVHIFGGVIESSSLWAYTMAISFLIVSVLSPVLSGISDYTGSKKRFMQFFCYLGALSCGSLFFFSADYLPYCLLSMILGSVGFWGSIVFYNSYLPEIAEPADHDRISARGFSMGYLGSVILLVLNLIFILFPSMIFPGIDLKINDIITNDPGVTLQEATDNVSGPYKLQIMRFTFVTVMLWWAGFAQLTFKVLPNNIFEKKPRGNVIFNGFKELLKVWKEFNTLKSLKIFLISFFLYSMAVQTLLQMAVLFANQEIEMGSAELIVCTLLIQLIAILGAWLFSRASAKFGNVKVLGISLFIWVGVCLWAYFIYTATPFYFLAGTVGLVMGGIQALSRSTYSKLLPDTEDHASYFSFFDVMEKIAIVLGLLGFGYIADLFGDMRNTTFFLAGLFMIGLLILFFMPHTKALSPSK